MDSTQDSDDELRQQIARLYFDTYDLIKVAGKSMPPRFQYKVKRLIDAATRTAVTEALDKLEAEADDHYNGFGKVVPVSAIEAVRAVIAARGKQ